MKVNTSFLILESPPESSFGERWAYWNKGILSFLILHYCGCSVLCWTKGVQGKIYTKNCQGNKKHCSVANVDCTEASDLSCSSQVITRACPLKQAARAHPPLGRCGVCRHQWWAESWAEACGICSSLCWMSPLKFKFNKAILYLGAEYRCTLWRVTRVTNTMTACHCPYMSTITPHNNHNEKSFH